MNKCLIAISLCLFSFRAMAQKTEVLLIGTFHFSNPGLDAAKLKTVDVLSPQRQAEIKQVAQLIEKFKPTKFFVEHNYNEQQQLDSCYHRYLQDPSPLQTKKSDEVYQLAFRVGKSLRLPSINAINYSLSLPFDSVLTTLENRKQYALRDSIFSDIQRFSSEFDSMISKQLSILDMLLYLNRANTRTANNRTYTGFISQAGAIDEHIGAFLTAQWYKRNIYMLSFMRKGIEATDKRVVVMLGSSHIALFELLLKSDPSIKIVELKDLL